MIKFNRYKNGKQHCLTFSYDDGATHDIRLVEIFNRYGVKGTFHLNSGNIGREDRIKPGDVKTLYEGHEVACHSINHPYPTKIPQSAWLKEVLDDRINLEKLVGYPVRGMSYPYGEYNSSVIQVAKDCGIVYNRTVESTSCFNIPSDFMKWHPTCHHNGCMACADSFYASYGYNNDSRLFYVWGHSFEFDRDNNWDLIEEFCKKMSADENIWFATNIEIYDYIDALRRLQFTADNKTVYNPTMLDLWFTSDGETVKIAPGETLHL